MWELNQLIRDCKEPRKKEILKELKSLVPSIDACLTQPYKNRKEAYYDLQKGMNVIERTSNVKWKNTWKTMRKLLLEYFSLNGTIICKVCDQIVDTTNGFTLHHKKYKKPLHLIFPSFCSIIHTNCHSKELDKEIKPKKKSKKEVKREMEVEILAKLLHEAGREAVLKGKTVVKSMPQMGLQAPVKFLEWEEITEDAKEGRRIQARYLLSKCVIYLKKQKTEEQEYKQLLEVQK